MSKLTMICHVTLVDANGDHHEILRAHPINRRTGELVRIERGEILDALTSLDAYRIERVERHPMRNRTGRHHIARNARTLVEMVIARAVCQTDDIESARGERLNR